MVAEIAAFSTTFEILCLKNTGRGLQLGVVKVSVNKLFVCKHFSKYVCNISTYTRRCIIS